MAMWLPVPSESICTQAVLPPLRHDFTWDAPTDGVSDWGFTPCRYLVSPRTDVGRGRGGPQGFFPPRYFSGGQRLGRGTYPRFLGSSQAGKQEEPIVTRPSPSLNHPTLFAVQGLVVLMWQRDPNGHPTCCHCWLSVLSAGSDENTIDKSWLVFNTKLL